MTRDLPTVLGRFHDLTTYSQDFVKKAARITKPQQQNHQLTV
jgi:hypothetical protein